MDKPKSTHIGCKQKSGDLSCVMRGVFSSCSEQDVNKNPKKKGIIKDIWTEDEYSVAIISNVPSEKSENYISQSMEKLLDGIVPESEDDTDAYSLILLAKPTVDCNERKSRLFEI